MNTISSFFRLLERQLTLCSSHFAKRHSRPGSIGALLLCMSCVVPLAAHADESAPSMLAKSKVNEASGAYSESILVRVPKFHGLEPQMMLSYNSSVDNGVMGVGWSLNAGSLIERASPGGGTPRYDSTDVFVLDGEPLVACTTFGGTHCPLHQTYQKIVYDAAANSGLGGWTLWDKDGGYRTYTPRYYTNSSTYRWTLNTDVDVHGNTVTYGYSCSVNIQVASTACMLNKISYNGAEILLYFSASRTDPVSFATGYNIVTNDSLLATIAVKVGTNFSRAYSLVYETNAATNRSQLRTVTDTGRPDSVSSAGVVSGGTSLPAVTLTYQNNVPNWTEKTYSGAAPVEAGRECLEGDFNGDGRTDLTCYSGSGNTWNTMLSTGSNFPATAWVGPATSFPVANRCIVGDFNGDGKSDLSCFSGTQSGSNGLWNTYLSTGTGFTNAGSWIGPWVSVPIGDQCLSGDINGDGKTDVACQTGASTGSWVVYFSAGSSFNAAQGWGGPVAALPVSKNCFIADFNGDGKSDVSCSAGTSGIWKTGITNATGSAFINADWIGPGPVLPMTNQCLAGDFNGDGNTDITCYTGANGQWHTVLSTGANFGGTFAWGSGPSPGGSVADFCAAADMNGDGRTDLLCLTAGTYCVDDYMGPDGGPSCYNTSTGGGWYVSRSAGSKWLAPQHQITVIYREAPWRQHCFVSDVTGDGQPDMVCHQYATTWYNSTSDGKKPDLLTKIENGMGGSTTVAYTPSSSWSNSYMPVGSVSQTVLSTSASDGRGTTDTTSYTYSGAKWSDTLRRPFGYARTEVAPSDGSWVNLFFLQTNASPGVLNKTQIFSGGTLQMLRSTTQTYTENSSAPYTSLLTREELRENNRNTDDGVNGAVGPFRTRRIDYAHNSYGEVTKIIDHGDIALLDRAVTKTNSYVVNATAYVVRSISEQKTFAGVDVTTGTPLRHSRNYYDNATDIATIPTKGNVTKMEEWNNVTNGWAATSQSFDSYGNITQTIDAASRKVSTSYTDVANAAFPNVYAVSSCHDPDLLNQCRTTKWDVTIGLPIEEKDANNAVVATGYDKLARRVSQSDPGLNAAGPNVTTWSYFNWGTPGDQGVQRIRPDGSPVDSFQITGLWENTYMDGLGRTWKIAKKGLSSTTYVMSEIYYQGASDRVVVNTEWHYPGDTGANAGQNLRTTTAFDELGRVLSVTYPDTSCVHYSYGNDVDGTPLTKIVGKIIKFNGSPVPDDISTETTLWHDADNNLIKSQEKDEGGQLRVTTHEYDLLGRKKRTVDAATNVTWSATYNSLGHMLTETDPDRGVRTYTYNNAGDKLSSTDAKNQTTTLTLDTLGRVKTSVAAGQTSTWYYDETGASYGAGIGRNTRIVYPGGSKSNKWDIRALHIEETHCIGTLCRTTSSAYDSIGRLATVTYPDLEKVVYAYDAGGQMKSVTGAKTYVSSLTWTRGGQLASIAYGNGTEAAYSYSTTQPDKVLTAKMNKTGAAAGSMYTTLYDYDDAGRLTYADHQSNLQFPKMQSSYEYDPLSRLRYIKNGDGTVRQEFRYNAIGNITYNSKVGTYTYDSVRKHAVASAGAKAYTYDANGSVLTGAANGYVATWDAQERMASLSLGGVTSAFSYDEGEQRVKKVTGNSYHFYFSPLVERHDTIDEQYYYAGPILVARKKLTGATPTTRWYFADRQGSVRVMTDETGTNVREYDYDAFGDRLAKSGTQSNERGYTGHVEDDETGFIYMNARYYDPILGRFVSADSIVGDPDNSQEYNRYSYVDNDPMNSTDPTGHQSEGIDGLLKDADPDSPAFQFLKDAAITLVGADALRNFIEHPSLKSGFFAVATLATSFAPPAKLARIFETATRKAISRGVDRGMSARTAARIQRNSDRAEELIRDAGQNMQKFLGGKNANFTRGRNFAARSLYVIVNRERRLGEEYEKNAELAKHAPHHKYKKQTARHWDGVASQHFNVAAQFAALSYQAFPGYKGEKQYGIKKGYYGIEGARSLAAKCQNMLDDYHLRHGPGNKTVRCLRYMPFR